MSGPRPPAAAAAAAANPSASPSRPLHPTPPPPPAAAARSSVAAARVREEGEVSSGADDEEPLRTHLTTPSNFSKYTEASAQVLSATFPGKGSNSLSLSSVFPLKTVAPSYKKTVRVNQGLYKPGTNRNLTWQKPVSSDNLVITFSDDDSGSDSGKSKQDKSRERKESSQGAHRTGINMNTGIMREEAPQQKTHTVKVGSANWSAVPLALRNSGVGRGSSATFARRDPPVRQVTPQKATYKDGNVVGVSSTVHKLESLRHKIAARENELKVKKPMSPGLVKESGFLTGQKRLPLDKIGFEASDTGACSRPNGLVGHDGRPTKRLKPNQECTNNQAGANMITPVPTGNSLGKNNVQSIESSDHIENGSTMDCDVNETEHAVRTEPVDGRHGDATKNFSSSKMQHRVQFANGQSMVEDASALVPITSIQAGGSVETASIQVKDHVCSTWNEQHVMPASTSTVSNLRAHLQSGIENAEPNSAVQIGIGGQNTSLLSLFEMEEFHERELEDAQEHRRKCEVEEREALRAYRRAQRALIEANERCAILRRRREVFSAQIHSSITENSSLVQPLSIQNAGHGLIIPALLDSQISADFQMLGNQGGRSGTPYPDEPPQHPVDKHESRSRYCDELAASTADPKFMSTVNGNITPSDYMEEDLQFPSTKQARSDCISNLENHVEETIHAYSEENRQTSGESVQDYELLEASLRSRLVERFGKKPYLNNAGEATEELTTGKVFETEHEKLSAYMGLLLHEADENAMTNAEGTMDLANDRHEKIADSSNAPCMGNCDPKDNISSLRELCMPSSMTHPTFPPSAPQNAARHMKCVFSGFPKKASDYKNACLTSNAASEATVCVPDVTQNHAKENAKMHSTTRNDKDIVCSGIDPFWPFCMFELRGKCNDEECQWQHVEHHAWRKSKHTKHAMPSDSGLIPYGLFQHILPVPTYRVGSNLIRADMNLIQSVLASSIWQYWQRGFCASFPLPLSVQRVLPSDAPFLQAGDDSDARFDRNRQLLNFRMLDNRKNKIVQGSVDAELFLEGALVLYFGKVNKPDRLKALLLLARAIEADPSTVILWVFYLHIYYQKDEGLGKDDMFSHAVQHNVYSYELWLMYINSRLRFDDRLDAYNDALSMLCQMTADTEKELKNRSAFVLDIFLQMVYFLCMSGNVEKAISRIYGILPTATPDFSGDKLLADVISCLTASDRCIFWISCLYVSIYRKLPEEITDQLEVPKDLPHALVWSPIEVRVDNRSRHIELLNYAADKISIDINETVKNGDPSYLRLSQFLAVNHISCLAALEGFQSCANVLVKYMKEYPMCPQILLLSARLDGKYGTYSDLKGFDELLQGWPKEVQGIQYLWNQYAEHALADNIELAEKVLTRWFEECGNDSDMQRGAAAGAMEISNEDFVRTSISSTHQVGSGTSISEDQIFWLLNLSLYRMLENNLQEAKVAVDKALKLTHGENYEHCLREHAAIHTLEKLSSYTDIQTQATFSIISGYLLDERNLPMRELLSRRFMQNVKKHRLRQLIDDTIGPASADYSLINSVLEVCYGPSLLPEKMGEVRYLVDFVESVMEVLPANYRLALAVGKFVVKHCAGADSTSMGTRFWASSVLINAIFRAVPVAPESVWLEGANLLEKLQAAETVKRFYQQATSVYPFSFRLWHAYLNTCKASGSNTESIAEAARQRGIELNITPP